MPTSITRIIFQGFKSFNKRISIPLLPGFNVIAGPNGSGKSNVVDGVTFVLGRTSAKSMRADRLHEMIFHGGEGKKPAEYASVTIYFDNKDKVFKLDEDEISVTRKVNKRGVSIYKLNGKTTTREKILQVLSAAKIDADGHNIVLQGDVTSIIEMNPIERRYIIDQISGIAEYNDKKEKANKDLEAVDSKLKEAEIILTQRYELFKKLESEKNAAMRHQELTNQIKLLKASIAFRKRESFGDQMKKIEEALAKAEETAKKVDSDLEATESGLESREKEIRSVADKLVNISKTVQVEREVSDLRSKILLLKDRIATNVREMERIDDLVDKMEVFESRSRELSGETPRSVQTIIGLKMKGVHGTIADLITVPDKYRVAMEVAAGPHINDIVVDDENVASSCIEFLRREKIGRATFLPLTKIKPVFFKDENLLSKQGVIGVASRLLKYDKSFKSAVEFVFGNTLIVQDLESAKKIGVGTARMSTLEGDLVERSGAMIGGHYRGHGKQAPAQPSKDAESYRNMKKNLEHENVNLRDELEQLEKKLKSYDVSESTKELMDLEKVRISSEKDVDELRNKRRKLHEKKVNVEIELNRLRIDKARLEADVSMLESEVSQYGQMEYLSDKISDMESNLKKSEKELFDLGAVNMKAIDEFDRLKVDFDEYRVKYEKILEEKKAVLSMIEEIDARRRETFFKALNLVNEEFNKIYERMIKGTARLQLEEPDNIESGLEIRANPRGKMLLNIDSMSGGEKTMTALSFLFAIQRYNPAPFYIFDEVDAALDKENSRMVAVLVKNLSKESQFIMITHNDQTIRQGDTVYGVTMEAGESKIIGLELPKA